jgi:protease-4
MRALALPGRAKRAPLLLELDLTQELLEAVPEDPLGWIAARRKATLRSLLDRLADAADDPRVRGLVAKVGGRRMGLARAQELRDAVSAFGRGGKLTVAWSNSFGEEQQSSVPYYLATAFREIWLQPSGELGLIGLSAEAVFLRGALERAKVQPLLHQRYEYKSAADMFMQQGFTEANREMATRLAESGMEQIVDGIATARGLPPARVRELVDQGPFLAAKAVEAGLVDRLGYRDEVYADVRKRLGEEPRLLFVQRYTRENKLGQARRRLTKGRRPVVAMVVGTGSIHQGNSRRGNRTMGSDTVTATLRAARQDKRVRAVVFRVNSPGGSYVASDAIWREVSLLRAEGKPVVVSMGDVAGSGGYFVAMNADVIVAQPGTLTGSIGVLGGKLNARGLLERLGVAEDGVPAGRQARMFLPVTDFTEEQWQRLDGWLDLVYDDFTAKVAEGRRMSRDRVHELARGRVWTGADAHERGLVDELGGMHRAAAIARRRAALPADAELRAYPAVAPLKRMRPPANSESPAAAHVQSGWGGWADLARGLGLAPDGPLTMPPVRLG